MTIDRCPPWNHRPLGKPLTPLTRVECALFVGESDPAVELLVAAEAFSMPGMPGSGRTPPVQPAPQDPDQPPAGYGQPAPHPYAPPPGYVQQPNPQQVQYVPYPSAQQLAPAGQWVPAGPAGPRSSGYRVASSIVAIVLGIWLFLQFLAGASVSGFAPFLFLIAAFGTIASAIVLLAKQRGRLREAPALLLGWTLFALLVCFIVAIGFGVHRGTLVAPLLAAPVLIIMGIGLSREKRGL